MNKLKQNDPGTWQGMVVDFETKKRSGNPNTGSSIHLIISHQFAKMFEKHSGEDVLDHIKTKKHLGIKFTNGMLRLTGETIKKMYSEVIQDIGNHIGELLRDVNGDVISKMFVVGAFAESAYIQDFLTSTFSGSMDVLIPEEAGMCVMRGAVLFGNDTKTITSRIARFNYYTACYLPFDIDKHDPSRKIRKEKEDEVRVLDRLIFKGQRMNVDDVVERKYTAGYETGTTFYFPLYCNDGVTTDDPDHPSVTLLEELKFESPNVSNPDRQIKYLIRFGGTDISMTAIDEDSGIEASTTVQI